MGKPRGASWDVARTEVFEPLLAQDPESWGPRVQPYLDRIAALEAERELRGADYRRAPAARRLIQTLAALSHQADFSIGCYCEDESHCHRKVLIELIRKVGS